MWMNVKLENIRVRYQQRNALIPLGLTDANLSRLVPEVLREILIPSDVLVSFPAIKMNYTFKLIKGKNYKENRNVNNKLNSILRVTFTLFSRNFSLQ